MNNSHMKTSKLTGLAIFTAIIVVLQVLATFIKFGPVSITLALAPIIIGAAVYGAGAGAYLGFALAAVILAAGLLGWDGGFVMYLMSISPIGVILTIFLKSTAAGYLSGVTYRAVAKKSSKAASVVSGIVCPVVNTGLFILCMFLFFFDALTGMAAGAGKSLIAYIIFGLCGINFVIELVVNLALSSVITHVVCIRSRSRRIA